MYKNYDPRATIIKEVADQVFEVTGRNPLLDIALELERIALADEYFISHRLYPNVDFYSGIIYQAMGFPAAMFPVLFAIGRMPGWLAHWQEARSTRSRRSPGRGKSTSARPCVTWTGTRPDRYLAGAAAGFAVRSRRFPRKASCVSGFTRAA